LSGAPLTDSGGKLNRLGGGLLVVEAQLEVVVVDVVFVGDEGQGRDEVVLLGFLVHGSEVGELHFAGGFDADGHAGGVLADGEAGLEGLPHGDDVLFLGGGLKQGLLGEVGLAAEVGDGEALVAFGGLDPGADLELLAAVFLVLDLDVDLGENGHVDLHVLVQTGRVAVQGQGVDEAELGLDLRGGTEIDNSGLSNLSSYKI